MNTIRIFRTLGPVDLKNIRRDALLMWMPVMPLMMVLAMRIAVAPMTEFAQTQFDFDLVPYYPLLVSFYLLLAPGIVGFVIGFLLLDERDDHTLTALMVTPLPMTGYLLYLISVPMILGLTMTLAGYPLLGLIPLPPLELVLIAILGAFSGAQTALLLAALAENKVSGLAVMKMLNGVQMFPVLAFFIPSAWAYVIGIVPSFWSVKLFWLVADGLRVADFGFWLVFCAGLAINVLVTWALLRRFNQVIHR